MPLPTNCLVRGTKPRPLAETEGFPSGIGSITDWEAMYQEIVKAYPRFIVTRSVFATLRRPAIVYPSDLLRIFGRMPSTQNPGKISRAEYLALLELRRAPNGRLS
jgi:hypothetical protein